MSMFGVDLAQVAIGPRQGAAFRRKYGIAEDRHVVFQVGWLISKKGVADLAAAAPAGVREIPL